MKRVTAAVLEQMAFTTGKTIYMRGNTGYLRIAGVLFVAPIGSTSLGGVA